MYVSTSEVNQQNIVINKLLCPQGINLAGSPNIVPDIGALAYDSSSSILYYGDGTIWTPLAANTGSPISISNFGSSPNLKGLTLMGSVLNLEPASSSFPGGVSITAQTISGVKTFNDSVILPSLSSTGIVHNDAGGNLSTSLIFNSDISASAAITDNKLNPIATTGKVLNSATTATSSATPSTIVLRDGSNNFSANIITANTFIGDLTGNASSSTSFSGNLSGDVTGPQSNTVVAQVSSVAASLIASGATLANAGTSVSTPNTLVKRDGSGGFSCGTIIGSFTGNLSGNATTATSATNWSGILLGDVTGTQSSTVVAQVGAVSASLIASGATLANNASTSTAGTIVKRDGSGDFSARIITATTFIGNLTGNVTGNASSSTNSVSFSGPLLGDVTGNQSATVVSLVGGLSAALTAAGAILANASTSVNTASTIVKRDSSGDFTASTITNTNLTTSGVINLVNTTSSSLGVINKGGNRFIHNYGTLNTFVGVFSGNFTLTGQANSAFGAATLSSITTGSFNTAGGWNSLEDNTIGEFNTAYGLGSLQSNISGNNNIAVGPSSLGANTIGNDNTSIGMSSLILNISGSSNTTLGFNTGSLLTSGNGNLFLGSLSGSTITTTSNNINIANVGVLGDSGVIRFGTSGTHLKNFQAGIRGITADATDATPVYISSTGQLCNVSTGKGCGTIYSGVGSTTVVSGSTWTLLTGLTSSTNLVNFTRPADNRLNYSGIPTALVACSANVSMASSAAANLYVCITKNGATPTAGIPTQGNIAGAINQYINFAPSGNFSFSTSDYLSLWVFSSVGATITTNYASLSANTI